VALNVYYFMYKGASKMMPDWLQLDKDLGYYTAKQIGGSVGIAVAVGVVWALLIQFLPACFQITVPALRRKLENERKKGTFDNVDGDVEMKLSNGANGNGNGNGSSDTEELNNLKKENVELKAKLGLNPDGSKVSCLNKAKNLFDCSDIEKGTEKSDHVVGLKSNMTDYGKDTEYVFSFLQIFTACVDALGHGANDVANSIAPLTAVYTIYLDSSAVTDKKVDQVLWIIVLGGAGIVAGLALYGRNIIRALGVELVSLSPSRGFTIELGAAFVIVGGSMLGLPLSTTHCQVGAETAVGMLEGAVRGVNWKFMAAIFAGWVFTLVIAGCLSALFFGFATSSPSLGGLEGTRNLVLSGSSDLFANVSVPLTISSQIVTRNFEQTSVACTF